MEVFRSHSRSHFCSKREEHGVKSSLHGWDLEWDLKTSIPYSFEDVAAAQEDDMDIVRRLIEKLLAAE